MSRFIIEVRGANTFPVTIGDPGDGVEVVTLATMGWCKAEVARGHWPTALYSSRKVAEDAVRASNLLPGQRWRVRVARSKADREKGELIR